MATLMLHLGLVGIPSFINSLSASLVIKKGQTSGSAFRTTRRLEEVTGGFLGLAPLRSPLSRRSLSNLQHRNLLIGPQGAVSIGSVPRG
jgi:hypothetical protein